VLPFLQGRLGWSWREVFLCPVVSLQAAMRGKEDEDRRAWEIARWRSYNDVLLCPHIKQWDKPNNPVAFHRFPWEKEEVRKHEPVVLEQEQLDELIRVINGIGSNNKSS
jgi:hypothetical protein